MTRPDQNISRINPPIRINSLIWPTFNIPLTRPMDNIKLTRPMESIPLTRPMNFELITWPMDFELLTRPTEFSEENEKQHVSDDLDPENHRHTHHWRKRNAIRRKIVVNTGKMICQTHHQAKILIRPMTAIIYASDVKRISIRKKDPIKLCARLTAKFLTAAFK